jgi:HEAT repeat protein
MRVARTFFAVTLSLPAVAACQSQNESVAEAPWSSKGQPLLGEVGHHTPTLHQRDMPGELRTPSGLRAAAIDLLVQATQSADPLLRANAIEALHAAPSELEPVIRRAVVDDNRGVRFVAAMTAGKLHMASAATLIEPLLKDDSPSVRAAAIYALRQCGRSPSLSPLGSMILDEDPEVRGNAALVLGELGNPSAVPMLREAASRMLVRVPGPRRAIVDLQIAEAMIRLGQMHQLEVVRAALFSPAEQGELTALACMVCGRAKDAAALPDLIRLATRTDTYEQPAEVRLAATWAVAQIEPGEAPIGVPMFYTTAVDPQIRAQAAATLGVVGNRGALPTLGVLLADPDPGVQVAAAGAIIQIEQD